MSQVTCCDPEKLPNARSLVRPNCFTLANAAPKLIHVASPSVVVVLGSSGVGSGGVDILIWPGQGNPTTQTISRAEGMRSVNGVAYLQTPGSWTLYQSSGGDVECVVLPATDIGVYLGEIIRAQDKPLTFAAPTSASIGAADASIVAANLARRFLVLVNTHASQYVDLAFDTTALANKGIRLYANQAIAWSKGDPRVTAAIRGIASGAATVVQIQEAT